MRIGLRKQGIKSGTFRKNLAQKLGHKIMGTGKNCSVHMAYDSLYMLSPGNGTTIRGCGPVGVGMSTVDVGFILASWKPVFC